MDFYRITFPLFLLFHYFFFSCRAQAIFSSHFQVWKSNKVNFGGKKKNQNSMYVKEI